MQINKSPPISSEVKIKSETVKKNRSELIDEQKPIKVKEIPADILELSHESSSKKIEPEIPQQDHVKARFGTPDPDDPRYGKIVVELVDKEGQVIMSLPGKPHFSVPTQSAYQDKAPVKGAVYLA